MKNPVFGFIAFLIVEGLITFGFLDKSQTAEATMQIENIIFYVAMALTGLLGFHQYIGAHKHQVTKDAEVQRGRLEKTENTNHEKVEKIKKSEDTTSANPGTPPAK